MSIYLGELEMTNNHYTKAAAFVEPIFLCEKFDFCIGNVIKYILRADYKGEKKTDLEKAINYFYRARDKGLPYKKIKKHKRLAKYYNNPLLNKFFNIDSFDQETVFCNALQKAINEA